MKKVKQQNKSGISLIVLVITIIVMIILAAAIILSLDGSDIIERAKDAQSASDVATAKEIVALAKSEWAYEKVEGYDTVIEYAEAKLEDAGYKVGGNGGIVLSETSTGINTLYIGSDNREAIIPEGFIVSTVATEDTVTEGLVIIDKDGNEFVWVPVDNYARFERTTKYKASETIADPGTTHTEPFSKGTLSLSNDLTGEYAEEAKMRVSVQANGGFYIARYEAGLPEGKTPATVTITDKPVSKKGATVWNSIVWGKSMTEIGTSGAVYRARQMYKSSPSVVSTLCYGVQWDAALQFIATKDAIYPIDSTEKGYYVYDSNGEFIEGMEEKEQPIGYYSVNNIYDMAGNVYEWTMEAHSSVQRVFRGGDYGTSGATDPASSRINRTPDDESENYGFRITLYIK